MEEYTDFRRHNPIKYEGYIDKEKRITNIRIISLNINRFKLEQKEKITRFIEYCKINNVDIALLIETNTKW